MSKKIGVGYSFKEKSLEKENAELKAEIKKLKEANKKADNKKEANKKADNKKEANKKAE